jgi:hypothetical protein
MLPLPDGLTIERSEHDEVRLTEQARAWIASDNLVRDPGIHASDLMDPRLAYWRALDPKPLTDRTIWLFVVGKVLHHFVVDLPTGQALPGQSDSGTRKARGILFSPDRVTDTGTPIELKTNRIQHESDHPEHDYAHYLEQLCTYMALMDVTEGSLWVLHINFLVDRRTEPQPRCYTVRVPASELVLFRAILDQTREQLIEALAQRNIDSLPLCRTWLCGTTCSWWKTCQPPGRYPLPKRQWSA